MRRDRMLVPIAAGLCVLSAAAVALLQPAADGHEPVRLAQGVHKQEEARARDERIGKMLAESVAAGRAAAPAEAAGTAPSEALPEGHASGDDENARYGFREEEGTLRRFVVVQDPSAALSPFGGR